MKANKYTEITAGGITFTRIENDINGNPRYVVHFLDVLTKDEREALRDKPITFLFKIALAKAKKIGGATYRAKWYGGGIVLSSYNLDKTAEFFNTTL